MKCEYCNSIKLIDDRENGMIVEIEKMNERHYLYSTCNCCDMTSSWVEIKYCPMCGRKLSDRT